MILHTIYKVCILIGNRGYQVVERVKPEIQEAVNNNLKTLIREKAGNVTAFAKSIGTSRDSVNNWLQGKSDIRLNDLVAISEKYGWSVDYLLGLADSPTRSGSKQAAEEYTGLSPEAVDNIRYLKEDVSSLLPELGIDPGSLMPGSIDAMSNVLVKFLSCYGLKAFLASLVNVGLAASSAKVAIDKNMTGAEAGQVLTRLRFALYSSGEAAQGVAREMFHLDKWEEGLRLKAAERR